MYNKEGNGLNSNEDGDGGVELNKAELNNIMERTVLKIQHEIDKHQEEKEAKEAKHTASIPKPPDDWTHITDTEHGEPEFDTIDNPGNWPQYCF